MENNQLCEGFITYLMTIKRYSPHTITSYRTDLLSYAHYMMVEYGVEDKAADLHHLRSYLVYLKQIGLSTRSINRKISAIKSFYKYLKRKGVVAINPASAITVLKSPKRLPSYVDGSKIDQLLISDEKQDFNNIRNLLVIKLLYITGIRRQELIGLKLKDVDGRGKTIKVLGKGNKERIIPVSDYLMESIESYIEFMKENKIERVDDNLILTNRGKKAYPKLIYNIVNDVLKKYNLSDKHSPHVLRHTFATHLSNNGADLNAIKELLGHSSLAATQIYTHNTIERLKSTYEKAHPKS